MATETRDPGYSGEKRKKKSDIQISLNTHFFSLGFVNGTITFVS